MAIKKLKRCAWVPPNDELYGRYHDTEWGVPVFDDRTLFEFIVLESAQAGLSWRIILNKRKGYKKLFKNFNPKLVAKMVEKDIEKLLLDSSIVRNRAKIIATINNAQKFIDIQKEFGSFSKYMWSWVGNAPIKRTLKSNPPLPSVTPLAEAMSKDLKKRGFKFLGPTVWYAHMQAVGMVNDHSTDCFRYRELN